MTRSAEIDPVDDLVKAALRVIEAQHYSRADDPHEAAEREYAGEQLALAARNLTRAVNQRPENERPIGWTE